MNKMIYKPKQTATKLQIYTNTQLQKCIQKSNNNILETPLYLKTLEKKNKRKKYKNRDIKTRQRNTKNGSIKTI